MNKNKESHRLNLHEQFNVTTNKTTLKIAVSATKKKDILMFNRTFFLTRSPILFYMKINAFLCFPFASFLSLLI